MKKLLYSHARVFSLAEVAYAWLYREVRRLARVFLTGRVAGTRGRRLLLGGLVLLTLVIEAVMLWILAELVDLSLSLFELYVELARKHLEITLDGTP